MSIFAPFHIIMVLLVALLLFGPEKIPEIARTLAKVYREMHRMTSEMQRTVSDTLGDLEAARPPHLPTLSEFMPRLDEPPAYVLPDEANPAKQAFETLPGTAPAAAVSLPASPSTPVAMRSPAAAEPAAVEHAAAGAAGEPPTPTGWGPSAPAEEAAAAHSPGPPAPPERPLADAVRPGESTSGS